MIHETGKEKKEKNVYITLLLINIMREEDAIKHDQIKFESCLGTIFLKYLR